MTEKFMTTKELAELLREPPETTRWRRSVGRGPKWFRIGKRVLYDVADVQAWLQEQKAATQGDYDPMANIR